MANTGVLPFVRGVDFSRNDFGVSTFSLCLNFYFVFLFSNIVFKKIMLMNFVFKVSHFLNILLLIKLENY